MKIKNILIFILLLSAFRFPLSAFSQGTAITYQGRLNDVASSATGLYDFMFLVYADTNASVPLVSGYPVAAVPVSNGLFTATIDFGAGVFDGSERWLRISVRSNGVVEYTVLSPRQKITATPYAVMAGTAAVVTTPPGMAFIPAGAFTMGDTLDGLSDALPISVTVSAFYMDVNLVSWSQWQSVYFWATNNGYAFTHPGAGKAANHPVQTVDWWDCVKWCNARSQQAGKPPVYYTDVGRAQVYTNGEPATLYAKWTASGYRLPTEAEWEKAARGGLSGQRFPWGNVINQNLANYQGDTASFTYDLGPNGFNPAFANGVQPYTSPVGSFAANGYGLYDMSGNVNVWCWDWYGTYAGVIDPRGPAGPLSYRVLRGGDWSYVAGLARCAVRNSVNAPSSAGSRYGFRCVRGF